MLQPPVYFFILLLAAMQLFGGLSYAAELSSKDNSELLRAIEDYRFQDFDEAISTLEPLHSQNPSHAEILKYLAFSYEEAGRFSAADRAYTKWRKLSPDVREAWVRGAIVLGQLERERDAIKLLDGWLSKHPDDLKARRYLGDFLVKTESDKRAESVWQGILGDKGASREDLVAANYNLALLAYRRHDDEQMRKYGDRVIALDSAGAYGKAAGQLFAASEQGGVAKQGFVGNVDIGGYYTSNVALLPDIITLAPGNKRQDYAAQTNLHLGYVQGPFGVHYRLESDWHSKQKQFDVMAHSVSVSAYFKPFTLSPAFEYVLLGQQMLYLAAGGDIQWEQEAWLAHYRLRLKKFSNSYGDTKINLRRLGGMANTLSVQRRWSWNDGSAAYAGIDGHYENTNGDATHRNSDSYLQGGLTAGYMKQASKALLLGVQLRSHYRDYRSPDTTLVTGRDTRKDTYVRLGFNTTYRPFEQEAHNLLFNASWQKNKSNYEAPLVASNLSKSYQEWRVGMVWRYQW